MRRPLFVAIVLTLAPFAAAAQSISSVGDLTAFITDEMQAERIPGLQVYASRDGAVLYHEALGLADADAGTPMTTETLTLLASVSKPVTAAALLTLIDDGAIGLDDPIDDHLPFQVVHPDYPTTAITPRMLLTHQSGIIDGSGDFDLEGEGDFPLSLDAFVRGLLTPGGDYYSEDNFGAEPGTAYAYTNDGIALMGYLVEAVSGQSFEAYSQEAIFQPLGMHRTSWFLAGLGGEPIAHPHVWEGGQYETLPHPGFADVPAGQLRTSAAQFAAFLRMIQNGGRLGQAQILEPSTVAAMLTPQVENVDRSDDDLGFVWYRVMRGGRVSWEHDGSVYGITTIAAMLPEEDLDVIVLANGEDVVLDDVVEAVIAFAIAQPTDLETPGGEAIGYRLEAPAPNPIAASATVRFHLAAAGPVTVEAFDLLGRRVATLADGHRARGPHAVTWDAGDLPSGAYLIRLHAGDTVLGRVATVLAR